MCQRGRKTVVFVTGLCPRRCFYCPLSEERRGRDVFYVNERRLEPEDVRGILREILACDSTGASLTGGDPLARLERTARLIRILKDYLSDDFHLHLYTTGIALSKKTLGELERAGLDELRIHPEREHWDKLELALRESSMVVGAEIPVLPDAESEIEEFMLYLDRIEAHFLNMNELEFAETNALALLQRGYRMRGDYVSAVGSRELAAKLIEWGAENTSLDLHFCPARIKDLFQTGLRLYRRASATAEPYETVTDEGLKAHLEVVAGERARDFLARVPPCMASVRGGRVLTSLHFAELARALGLEAYAVERYPTPGGLVASRARI